MNDQPAAVITEWINEYIGFGLFTSYSYDIIIRSVTLLCIVHVSSEVDLLNRESPLFPNRLDNCFDLLQGWYDVLSKRVDE